MMKNDSPVFEIEKLNSKHVKSHFSCGNSFLDAYLKNNANQDMKKNVSVSYVMTEIDGSTVLGYYTLSSISMDASQLTDDRLKRLPKYPLFPAILLGRLAVDLTCHGKGLGSHLLLDAMRRAALISEQVGIHAMVVDAKDTDAVSYYLRFGFVTFASNPLKLYLPINTIKLLNLK